MYKTAKQGQGDPQIFTFTNSVKNSNVATP